ncbi:hypothetical protein D3C72_1935520 [compost metagenome]
MKYVPNSPTPGRPNGMLSRRIFTSWPFSSSVVRALCEDAGLMSSSSSTFDSLWRPMMPSWFSTVSAFHPAMSCKYFCTRT